MPITPGPVTAEDDREIVVFLIGMTFNRPWKVLSWWPVFTAMPKMLFELAKKPHLGLLSARTVIGLRGPTVIQYWNSVEELEHFARAKDLSHVPAWSAFYKSKAVANGDVGIWHETFVTSPGKRENIYLNTPTFGFADAAQTIQPVGAAEKTAAKRRAKGEAAAAAATADAA